MPKWFNTKCINTWDPKIVQSFSGYSSVEETNSMHARKAYKPKFQTTSRDITCKQTLHSGLVGMGDFPRCRQ